MDFKDQLFIIKNRLFEKRNIILIIVLVIIFLILFSCLTIIQFSTENKKEILNSDDTRTYIVYSEETRSDLLDLIRNIDHVELAESSKYRNSNRFEVADFDNGKEKGVLYIQTLLKESDVKIKSGKNIENNYEMICSDTFYPHEFDERIYKDLFLSHNKILNKSVNIISSNEDLNGKEITLNIVGTYKNKYEEEANTCYVDKKTFDDISSKYAGSFESYDEYGNLISKTYSEYDNYFVIIDSKENVKQVLASLKELDIEYDISYILDTEFLNMLYSIPLFIGIVVGILTFSILYSFILKKINNRMHNIGIFKAIGYDEKTVKALNIKENIFIVIISSFISMVIYYIVLSNLRYTLLAEVTYGSYVLNVPYLLIVLSILVFIFIIVVIVNSRIKRIFNLSVQRLLEK